MEETEGNDKTILETGILYYSLMEPKYRGDKNVVVLKNCMITEGWNGYLKLPQTLGDLSVCSKCHQTDSVY